MAPAEQWVRFNCLSWNTKVSRTVTPAVWVWLQRRFPPIHALLLQEVTDLPALRDLLGPEWVIAPARRHRKSSTYVAVRRRRMAEPPDRDLADITFRSRYHRVITAINFDDVRSGRRVNVGSIHTDPLAKGLPGAHPVARRRHIRQVRAWATWGRTVVRKRPYGVQIMGGDVNERLTAKIGGRWAQKTAMAQFAHAGFRAAHAAMSQHADLDDVWVHQTPYCRIVGRTQLRPPTRDDDRGGTPIPGAQHFDHDVVYVSTLIRRRKRPVRR